MRDVRPGYVLALVVVLAGFWPSFLMRLADTDAGHMIHGVSATLWMTVPIVQASLMRRGRVTAHRRVGRVSLVLVPIVVVSGLYMVRVMIRDPIGIAEPLRTKLVVLDSGSVVFFALVLALAVRSIYRGDARSHAQYMTCSVIVIVEPGFERLVVRWVPGIDDFTIGVHVALLALELVTAALIVAAWRVRSTRHPYVVTLAYFLAIHAAIEPLGTSATFRATSRWVASW